ncbi:unnamed protein product [Arctogadus glacialis]
MSINREGFPVPLEVVLLSQLLPLPVNNTSHWLAYSQSHSPLIGDERQRHRARTHPAALCTRHLKKDHAGQREEKGVFDLTCRNI